MENRVDEFCLWIIQAIIIPVSVEAFEGWSTGYFAELDKYEDECLELFGHTTIAEEKELNLNISEEGEEDNQSFFWKLFTKKNIMYIILATQAIHLAYAVYTGKQFPVQPLSDFENSNIVWETVCLCARDATITMNHHILVLRLGSHVIYDVSKTFVTFLSQEISNYGFDFFGYINSNEKNRESDTTDNRNNLDSIDSDESTKTLDQDNSLDQAFVQINNNIDYVYILKKTSKEKDLIDENKSTINIDQWIEMLNID